MLVKSMMSLNHVCLYLTVKRAGGGGGFMKINFLEIVSIAVSDRGGNIYQLLLVSLFLTKVIVGQRSVL